MFYCGENIFYLEPVGSIYIIMVIGAHDSMKNGGNAIYGATLVTRPHLEKFICMQITMTAKFLQDIYN